MLEKFTPRAKKVMNIAQQYAAHYESDFVEPQHILLGIVDEGGGAPAKVFRHRKIGLKTVIDEITKLAPIGPPTKVHAVEGFPLSPRAQQVVELAGVIAEEFGQQLVGPEHLLLGMLKKPDGIAHGVLTKLGFKYNDLLGDVLRPEEKPVPPPRPAPLVPPPAPIGQSIPVVSPVAIVPPPAVAAAPPPAPVPPAVPVAVQALPPEPVAAPEPLIVIPDIPKVSAPEGFDPIEWFTSVLATCSAAEEMAKLMKEKLFPAMEAMKKFSSKK